MKTCRLCGETKPLEEFHRNTSAADGRQNRCKPCANAAARQWALDHPEQYRENLQRHRNTEQYKESRRAYREANAEKVKAQKREAYQRNRKAIRERQNARLKTPGARAVRRAYYARWRQQEPRGVHREAIWALYGLTLDQYDAMILRQEGRCVICNDELRDPHVDHCHTGGHVRAILCSPCNRGLGCFRDNPEALAAAIEYLRAHMPDTPDR